MYHFFKLANLQILRTQDGVVIHIELTSEKWEPSYVTKSDKSFTEII